MKLIKPSYRIETPINGEEILIAIEAAGRTAYKSEGKIEILEQRTNIGGKEYSRIGISAHEFLSKLLKRGHEAPLELGGMINVRFICDRGVTHELVRHRLASFVQESTRYCNYANGKDIEFIIPSWLDIKEGVYNLNKDYDNFSEYDGTLTWLDSINKDEIKYNNLVNQINPKTGKVDLRFRKWSPQEARSILPNSLKTEIVIGANIREWRYILRLRTAEGVHPQMRELMCPLLEDFKKQIPILFDDIKGE